MSFHVERFVMHDEREREEECVWMCGHTECIGVWIRNLEYSFRQLQLFVLLLASCFLKFVKFVQSLYRYQICAHFLAESDMLRNTLIKIVTCNCILRRVLLLEYYVAKIT